jgi:hypothetical protein
MHYLCLWLVRRGITRYKTTLTGFRHSVIIRTRLARPVNREMLGKLSVLEEEKDQTGIQGPKGQGQLRKVGNAGKRPRSL